MATDNKGVMVYLPPDLQEVLEKYCIENNITRKDKHGQLVVSLGTGIIHRLKSAMLGVLPSTALNKTPNINTRSFVTQDAWEDLMANVADLREQLTRSATRDITQLKIDVASIGEDIHAEPGGLRFECRGLLRAIDDAVDEDRLETVKDHWDDKLGNIRDYTVSIFARLSKLAERVEKLEAQQLIATAPNHVEKTLDILMRKKRPGKN
jgi:hypothetical protein